MIFKEIGTWAILTIIVHTIAYVWQMTRPVTNHMNWVRILIRKLFPQSFWKIIFWRKAYKNRIQNKCYMWFLYVWIILGYVMINSVWMLRIIFSEYKDDIAFTNLYLFVLVTSSYIVIESLAMDLIIMIVIMFFMIFSLVIWFPCIIVCQNLMTWRPRSTNDVNRASFEELLNSKVMFMGIFLK